MSLSSTVPVSGAPEALDRQPHPPTVSAYVAVNSVKKFRSFLPVLCAFLVSSYFYSGYYASDDMGYLGAIISVAQGHYLSPDLAALRLSVILPGSLMYVISGSIALSIYVFVFLHPLLVLVTYRIGCRLPGVHTAQLASWIVAFSPLIYIYSGALLPDVALALWTGIWLLIFISILSDPFFLTRSKSRQIFLFFAAGLVNGICYSTKESGLIIVVPAAIGILLASSFRIRRETILWGIGYLLGLFVFCLFELSLMRALTGQWVFRLGIISNEVYSQHLIDLLKRDGVTFFERFKTTFTLLHLSLGTLPIVSALFVAIIGLFYGRSVSFLSATFFWLLFYLTVGTTSLTQYIPPPLVERYFSVLVVPAALLLAVFISVLAAKLAHSLCLSKWADKTQGERLGIIPLLLVVAFGILTLVNNSSRAGMIYGAPRVRAFIEAYRMAGADPEAAPVVFSPFTSLRMFPLFMDGPINHFLTEKMERNPITNDLPAPPFLYLASASQKLEKPGWFYDPLDTWLGVGSYAVETIRTVNAPSSRWSELVRSNAPVLSLVHPPEFSPNTTLAFKIQRVTPIQVEHFSKHIDRSISLFASDAGAQSSITATGGAVTLPKSTVGKHVVIQLFDGGALSDPPRTASTYVPSVQRPLDFSVDLAFESGDIPVSLQLYPFSGKEVLSPVRDSFVIGKEVTSVSVKYLPTKPVTSFRFTVEIVPTDAGRLLLSNVHLRTAD